MSTTHPTNETTEWDDLQRKFGNLPPLKKEIKEEELYLKYIDKLENENILEKKDINELEILEEDCVDDEYIKIIEKYKKDRLNEINKDRAVNIYGDIYEITKDNFIEEINNASKHDPLFKNEDNSNNIKKKRGTYVVLHLYSDNVIACKILNNIMKEAAVKYKYIKFTKGVYNKIIENYPESKMPTILIYYNGVCVHQICNLLFHLGGNINNLNLKCFEKFLKSYEVIRNTNKNDKLSDDESEEENNNFKSKKQYTTFNIFNNKKNKEEEEDDNSYEESEKEHDTRGYASSYLDNKMRLYKF